METVIEEVEEPHRLIERGHGSRMDRMDLGTAWELVDGHGGTTNETVTFWTEPSTHVDSARSKLGASRWYRKQWKRALKRLQSLVENDDPIEPVRVAGTSRI